MLAFWILTAVLVGMVASAALVYFAFRLAATYQRTGNVVLPQAQGERDSAPADPNAAAHRRALEESIKKGADDLMAMAEASGQRITRQEAEAEAREILKQLHATVPLGGVN
jgi:flagellar biosynthesis/type III secretory pathway M-ring protein FliF/YscJ